MWKELRIFLLGFCFLHRDDVNMKGHSSHALTFKGTHLSVYAIHSRRWLHGENIPHPATSVVHRTCTVAQLSYTGSLIFHLFLSTSNILTFFESPKIPEKNYSFTLVDNTFFVWGQGSDLTLSVNMHVPSPNLHQSNFMTTSYKTKSFGYGILSLLTEGKDNRGSWSSQNAKCTQFSFKVPTVLNSSHTIE